MFLKMLHHRILDYKESALFAMLLFLTAKSPNILDLNGVYYYSLLKTLCAYGLHMSRKFTVCV